MAVISDLELKKQLIKLMEEMAKAGLIAKENFDKVAETIVSTLKNKNDPVFLQESDVLNDKETRNILRLACLTELKPTPQNTIKQNSDPEYVKLLKHDHELSKEELAIKLKNIYEVRFNKKLTPQQSKKFDELSEKLCNKLFKEDKESLEKNIIILDVLAMQLKQQRINDYNTDTQNPGSVQVLLQSVIPDVQGREDYATTGPSLKGQEHNPLRNDGFGMGAIAAVLALATAVIDNPDEIQLESAMPGALHDYNVKTRKLPGDTPTYERD